MSDKDSDGKTALERGADTIRALVNVLPNAPGVYRMLNASGDVLYVGKAKALKKRVVSYTQTQQLPNRLKRMVAETAEMVFVVTHTEVEALLLEANLIKKLKPRYNIQLRDGKSFSYILITDDHDYPQLVKYRGSRSRKGQYFGPFASTGAVNWTVTILQRAFMLRTCSDSVFAQRTRPCLQYHIKRCTAPCVQKVSKDEYAQQVEHARAFLTGKSRKIQDEFAEQMQIASDEMNFEAAASLRDRIKALTAIQTRQDINVAEIDDADIVAIAQREGQSCVQVFFFRGGHNYGNRAYFPKHEKGESCEAVLTAFLAQFYEDKPSAPLILISHPAEDTDLLEEALSARDGVTRRVKILRPERGTRRRLVDFVEKNASDALARHLLERAGDAAMLEGVAKLFGLDEVPRRIEVYDNSHISGTDMVGGLIVAGPEGFVKNAYRKFNIKQAEAGDDYGMMREVISRRFRRVAEGEFGPGAEDWPDLLLIDGGPGQLSAVIDTLTEMGIAEQVRVVAIAKGPDRNAGREKFYLPGRDMFQLPEQDPVLHYLQRLRDEVHRYAIGTHRARRIKKIGASPLDSVPGIGAKRKKALLLHFGSAQEVARAGINDLEKVEGISHAVAEKIYNFFHEKT
ncbi:MAG: excinuclease ABC subunit UvrC [Micavibrio sp.]